MGHKECMYHDNDALLYAVAKLGEHDVILSARETEMYDEYLGYAKNGDKELSIDVDSAENEPYSIVYGGLMFADGTFDDIKDTVESLKGNALLDLDRDKDELAASCYDDIAFFPEHKRADNCIPFAALMHTTHPFDNEDVSVTMFPCYGNLYVWECMVNRKFLLACRKKVAVGENVTPKNWKDQINKNELIGAYKISGIYTGQVEDN